MKPHDAKLQRRYRSGPTYRKRRRLVAQRRNEAQRIIAMLPKFRDRVTVAKILGISKQAVEQIEYKAIFKITVRFKELLPILNETKKA